MLGSLGGKTCKYQFGGAYGSSKCSSGRKPCLCSASHPNVAELRPSESYTNYTYQGRASVAGCKDANVTFDQLCSSRSVLRNPLRSMVEHDAVLGKALYVAAKPLCPARADELKHPTIDHRCFCEETLLGACGRRNVRQVAVEEDAQQVLRDP